jgi:endonuclease YncB( thermonuclease family)
MHLREDRHTARSYLSENIAGKYVTVEYEKLDCYGRIVGKVLLSDQDMCLAQLRSGLTWHHKKYPNEQSASNRKLYADDAALAKEGMRGYGRNRTRFRSGSDGSGNGLSYVRCNHNQLRKHSSVEASGTAGR